MVPCRCTPTAGRSCEPMLMIDCLLSWSSASRRRGADRALKSAADNATPATEDTAGRGDSSSSSFNIRRRDEEAEQSAEEVLHRRMSDESAEETIMRSQQSSEESIVMRVAGGGAEMPVGHEGGGPASTKGERISYETSAAGDAVDGPSEGANGRDGAERRTAKRLDKGGSQDIQSMVATDSRADCGSRGQTKTTLC